MANPALYFVWFEPVVIGTPPLASLRTMEQEEQKLQALIDGENSGPGTPLDMEEIRKKAKKKAGLTP